MIFDNLRSLVRRIPIFGITLGELKRNILYKIQPLRSEKKVFTNIYRSNTWNNSESRSGPGSSLSQTVTIVAELPPLFRRFNIKSVLDIPCGDFNWMQRVDLTGIDYLGGDIVDDIIENNMKYKNVNIKFRSLNIMKDDLPCRDLVLIRDCLVHLPIRSIKQALANVIRSKSTYLMMTHFTETSLNRDIFLGEWRPLNFRLTPFFLPPPICLINENCSENNGESKDKTLALWRVSDLNRDHFI